MSMMRKGFGAAGLMAVLGLTGWLGFGGEGRLFAAQTTGYAEEVKPEGVTRDGVQYGLAAKFARDAGLEKESEVLFLEDYEVDDLAGLEARGWVPRWGPGLWTDGSQEKSGWQGFEIAKQPGFAFAGTKCLRKFLKLDEESGISFGSRMTRDLAAAQEVLFVRTYVRLSEQLPGGESAIRILGVTGVPDGQPTYQTFGAVSPRPDGTGPFWVDLLVYNAGRGRRSLAVESQKTDTHYFLFGTEGQIPADRWFCVEMKLKLNTPGQRDGELRVWLEGKEVFTFPRMVYRSVEAVKIRSVHDQFRGNTRWFSNQGQFWVDDLVAARRYVGPAVDKPVAP